MLHEVLQPPYSNDEFLVSIRKAYKETQIEKIFENLEINLIGLKAVKKRIREIAAMLLVEKLRKTMSLTSNTIGLHMSFTGNPGTGKTTIALKMADILYNLGYIKKYNLLTVTRDDLVGQYIGHTAPKTKEVLKKAIGGVLLIDEAYYLYKPDNERDYGSEAIEILLQVMENQRDDLVVILAGYKKRMDIFYDSNPGFASRIANHIDFPDYTTKELVQIGKQTLLQQQYKITPQGEKVLDIYIGLLRILPQFANARSVQNILDYAKKNQSERLIKEKKYTLITKYDLVTLEAFDLKKEVYLTYLNFFPIYRKIMNKIPRYSIMDKNFSKLGIS